MDMLYLGVLLVCFGITLGIVAALERL